MPRAMGSSREKCITNFPVLCRIDDWLTSKRAQRLCDTLPRNRAYLLAQLRTGHSWLATCAKAKGSSGEDKCECSARETVVHVLVDCPRLRDLRQQLCSKIGVAFNKISAMFWGGGATAPKAKSKEGPSTETH
jgi:hypothetical protein